LTVSSGELYFDPAVTYYTINVASEVTDIDVDGTANHFAATVSGIVTNKTLEVGYNEVNLTVTAEDGTTVVYTVMIVRAASSDATLRSLTVSSGELYFDPAVTYYTVKVANSVTNIDVTGTANHSAATVTGNVTGMALEVGDNAVTITVIAEDGITSKTYTVTIHRSSGTALSDDATLSSLTVSSGELYFDPAVTYYTVNVASEVTNIDVTGTANHPAATVYGNVTNQTLGIGYNEVNLTVVAEDGTTVVYTVATVRAASSDATLSSLTVSSGELYFDPAVTCYTVYVANEVTNIDVTGTANHPAATVYGNVTNQTPGVGYNEVNLTVVAEDGTTVVYTVAIVRAASSDATLRSLTVSAGTLYFDPAVTDYTVNVSSEVTNIDITGVANHPAATVSGNVTGKTIVVGNNTATVTVTAEDGATQTYTVTIVRADHAPATEAKLVSIAANGTEITVAGNSIEYAAPCGETSLALDLQASPYSTVTVNGVEYHTDYDGQIIDLSVDISTYNIQVTAETGGAKSNYTLNINAPLNDSRLYYQRWDDVLAINLNPATNGGYNVSEIRWYGQDGTFVDDSGYIIIQPGTAQQYHAEVRTDGNKLRKACNNAATRSTDGIVAYPNPVPRGESVQLKLPESFAGGVLNIYDIKGNMVKSGLPLPSTDNSVNVSDLNPGIYLLHVSGKDGNRQVTKIIIE
jgi:hypothetical protein